METRLRKHGLWPLLGAASLFFGAVQGMSAQAPAPPAAGSMPDVHFFASADPVSVPGGVPVWVDLMVVNASHEQVALGSRGAGGSLLDVDLEYQVTRKAVPGEIVGLSPMVSMTTYGQEQLLPLSAKLALSDRQFTPQEQLRFRVDGGSYFGPLRLEPGRSYRTRILLSRLFDLTDPGEYTVQVTYRKGKAGDRGIVLTAPPIKIRVT
jgi:hypothetical protein